MIDLYYNKNNKSRICQKNFIHLVFVPKYRQNVFTKIMLHRLQDIFLETCEQMNAQLLEFGGDCDHVHLMGCCPPKLAISNLVSKLKGNHHIFYVENFGIRLRKNFGKIIFGHLVIVWFLTEELL